jgi:transcription antitermination factor NusG
MLEQSRSRWYVLQVRLNHESLVTSRLGGWGIEAFLPKYIPPKRPGRTNTCPQVLFPGYVFCHLQLPTNPRLYHMPGVIRLLGPPRNPTPVTDDEINRIKRIVDAMILIEPDTYQDQFDNPVVEIIQGPLAGMRGRATLCNHGCKLTISFPTLRCAVTMFIPSEWVSCTEDDVLSKPFHSRQD